jgi:hypothetical protein
MTHVGSEKTFMQSGLNQKAIKRGKKITTRPLPAKIYYGGKPFMCQPFRLTVAMDCFIGYQTAFSASGRLCI